MLNSVTLGSETGQPPLMIAHGLFGSARNWGAISKRLSDTRQVTAFDMRNHGESPWRETHGYEDMSADLANLIEEPTDILGHSMGGKTSMLLALLHPEKVRRLVVADIAPVAYQHSQRPLIEAMRRVDLSVVESRRDADVQLMPHVPEASTRAFLLQSLDANARQWRLNLDVLEAEMDRIMGFPEVSAAPFTKPVLFLTGAHSDYVRPEHRDRIKSLFPAARFAKIPEAGHWLHAENPRAFESAVRTFLDA